MTNEQTVERIDQQSIDTEYGTFDLYRYRELAIRYSLGFGER